ncbi:30S ribosome-binding factor RbfA [Thermodesulfobacteriota bacterium]
MAKKARSRFQVPGADTAKRRPARVADIIRREIAALLLRKVKDPRLTNVTITSVVVTDDLRRAKVLYSCRDDVAVGVADGLKSSKGFIRSHLARELEMRYVPDLDFKRDLSPEYQEKIERLLGEVGSVNGSEHS